VGLLASPGEAEALLKRHADDSQGASGGCRFSAAREGVAYDWIVVINKALTVPTSVRTDPRHLVYASMEPRERRRTGSGYLAQFSTVIAVDPSIRHPGLIRRSCPTWWFGQGDPLSGGSGANLSFRQVRDWTPPKRRSRRVSIVTSTQNWMPGHVARNRLIDAITSHPVGRFVDVYGRGRLTTVDKMNAIAPSRYHLVLENSFFSNYWSEKLSDAFLGYALPIYAGCTNLHEYFNERSFEGIDLVRPNIAIETIIKTLDEDRHEASLEWIREARDSVLYRHNILSILANVCQGAGQVEEKISLLPPETFREPQHRKVYRKTIWRIYAASRGVSIGSRPLWRLPP
jgi:hypothetical protein